MAGQNHVQDGLGNWGQSLISPRAVAILVAASFNLRKQTQAKACGYHSFPAKIGCKEIDQALVIQQSVPGV